MSNATPRPSLPENYTLHSGYPPLDAYLHLRAASGLTPKTRAQGAAIPTGSWYGCYITYTDPSSSTDTPPSTPVAMGRIIGDGGWYFHIADMAVLPEHQRKGLGDIVLKELLRYIRENAAEGEPYVTLLADPPGRKLYAKNGFVESAPVSTGMVFKGKRGDLPE
ncbi:Putative Gcn5-related n-acetyltransferase [Aspergillus calidoustus]|uniref:Putative Gcn5-related n-acetyltransferase n=1 Tax=Aspergillus calidoustus TaxID=454130 RepID=A0A0U5G385_ASPCI|nr:Putative Gcn5-related n-acetyltransferase [Aspergillus calidoustus]